MGDGDNGDYRRRRGVLDMEPERAIAALRQEAGQGATSAVVANMDWARFVPSFTLARTSPLIGDLPEGKEILAAGEEPAPARSTPEKLTRRLAGLPEADQVATLLERAIEVGEADEIMAATYHLCESRPRFETAAELGTVPDPVSLSTGVATPAVLAEAQPILLRGVLERNLSHGFTEDEWLTAMAHYIALDWWTMNGTTVSTLQVRAGDAVTDSPIGEEQKLSWQFARTISAIDVPGNHFTVMEEHAVTTAHVINT